jgi:hypothetical protein
VSTPTAPVIRDVSDEGALWLAGWNGGVVGGEYWEVLFAECPAVGGAMDVTRVEMPKSGMWDGTVDDGVLFLPARHSIDELDLSCSKPAADFAWYSMGTIVQLEDRTTLRDVYSNGYLRRWRWTIDGRRPIEDQRAPLVDLLFPGRHTVTLEVSTELGVSSVTKTIEIPRQQGLSPLHRESGGRAAPEP